MPLITSKVSIHVLTSLLITCFSPRIALSQPQDLDLPPELIKNSPVLQRWQQDIPNVLEDIRNQPRFSSRWRLGYFEISTDDDQGGMLVGVEDWWLGNNNLSFGADYQTTFGGDYLSYGLHLNYFVLPLGTHLNLAPNVGYRYFQGQDYHTGGVSLGLRLILALSSTGAADLSVAQNFVLGGDLGEVGITTLSVGYAITRNLRVAAEFEQQSNFQFEGQRWGILLELLGD